MVWKEAISLNTLQNKERHTESIDGHKILFIWHDDKVHAINSQCPHFKLPLTKGKITDENTIICPFHKSEFNLKSGEATCWSPWPPAIGTVLGKISKPKHLTVYQTKLEEDKIFVNLQ